MIFVNFRYIVCISNDEETAKTAIQRLKDTLVPPFTKRKRSKLEDKNKNDVGFKRNRTKK